MKKTEFKVIDKKKGIVRINGVQFKIKGIYNLLFIKALQPCIYELRFANGKSYIGQTKDGIMERLKNHISHCQNKNTLIANALCDSINNNLLIDVKILKYCDEFELSNYEKQFIHNRAKDIYNKEKRRNTDFKSYRQYKDIVQKYLLNESLV